MHRSLLDQKTEEKDRLLLTLFSPLLQQTLVILLLLLSVHLDSRHLLVVLERQVIGVLHLSTGRRHEDAVEGNDFLHLGQYPLRINDSGLQHRLHLLRLVRVVNIGHIVVQHIPNVAASNGLPLELILEGVHAIHTTSLPQHESGVRFHDLCVAQMFVVVLAIALALFPPLLRLHLHRVLVRLLLFPTRHRNATMPTSGSYRTAPGGFCTPSRTAFAAPTPFRQLLCNNTTSLL